MATGNPSPRRRDTLAASAQAASPDLGSTSVHLAYAGKKDEITILHTPPAKVAPVWPFASIDKPQPPNRLYFGDNLPILASLLNEPGIRGKVRLIYIDPPYATRSVFHSRSQEEAYDDLLSGAAYIEFMRERLVLLRELLADDGSIYVHLDKNMAFSIKIIMDEIFGASNFRNWITRKKCNPKNYTSRSYGNVSDYILFYTKSDSYLWNRSVERWTDDRSAKEYQYVDEKGRRYKKVPIHAPGVRRGETGKPWRGVSPPPGKHWQYQPAKLDEMDAIGDIYWSPTGNPRRKVYRDQSEGVPVQDIWLEFRDAHNQQIHITGYPTEKNSDLLARIIEASTNPGDVVLDCFAGSGTTLAVAQKLHRSWIGVDNSAQAIATTLRRFASGTKPMGDFVAAQKRKLPESEQTLQLPLFSESAENSDEESSPSTVVDNFMLLVEQSRAHRCPTLTLRQHSSVAALADAFATIL